MSRGEHNKTAHTVKQVHAATHNETFLWKWKYVGGQTCFLFFFLFLSDAPPPFLPKEDATFL